MKQDRCKLWNPWAAAGWSLLFSPAFGAWLHAANWHALGRPDKAVAARRWGWLVILAILLAGVMAALFERYARHLPLVATVALTATWVGFPAREHCRYVRATTGDDYRRRRWWPALLGGIAGWVALTLVSLGAATAMVGLGGFYL
ncbi:hypothetical protein [Pseudoduganella chitinolytica]|uniref:Uncharacterized protein n=1 Tax=Pseudoduganella chitinolytica TaxID=34070 RepID=A0ABY8BBQ6_9BURK|nr:hypothetical protein [Pseudoduganella chitinolytica]WEF32443.1 hypothetical protein PX653_24015 [Pseudoduganella chitinolytica]